MRDRFRKLIIYTCSYFCALFLVSCSEFTGNKKLFVSLSERYTNLYFSNTVVENDSINILEYLSAYNGGGIGAGDFNNDGLTDLYFISNQEPNKLFMNRGDFRFEDATSKAMVGGLSGLNTWTNGVTLVDINEDGWLDIYVCMMDGYLGLEGKNQLFINNTNGTFSEQSEKFGLNIKSYAQHSAFFDYDKDGDLDMYLLNQAVHTKESFGPAKNRILRDLSAGDRLYKNSDGLFIDVSEQAGIYGGPMGYGLSVSTGDINNDGWQDIYVSNDFHENDYLYYNQGDGTFKEDIMGSMGHLSKSSMGNDIGDFDNDGNLDILTLDMKPPDEVILKQTTGIDPYNVHKYKLEVGYYYQFSRNMLHKNLGPLFDRGRMQFSEIGQLMGISDTDWSWSTVMGDLDNDGFKDIFISNGIPKRPNSLDYRKLVNQNIERAEATPSNQLVALMPEGKSPNLAYRNNGERFVDISTEWGLDFDGYSNGAVFSDLDNDGDLDLVLNNLNSKATILRNLVSEQSDKNFIKIALMKNQKPCYFPGTRIVVSTDGQVQLQELKNTSGWLSSYSGDILFGIGPKVKKVNIKVVWPDGKQESIDTEILNEKVVIHYEGASNMYREDLDIPIKTFQNVSDNSGIHFTHVENNYIDFTVEPLIPYFLSTQGPKIAVGDVNGDGLDDFFIGGSSGQPGKIFLADSLGDEFFKEGKNYTFSEHSNCEDIGASLVDIDNDGDLDLLVASGSGELGSSELLLDRMYINDGNGNFKYGPTTIPVLRGNSSCVVPLDVNSDGFIDFFIGNRSTPGKYGLAGKSRLLINTKSGTYRDETDKYFHNGGNIGMVTDAVWIQETNELIVVGDWMPVTIFSLQQNKGTVYEIPDTFGWWNTICKNDLDDDGDMDFLVGNAGLNIELSATREKPIELFIKDFDGNLTLEPIIVYAKNEVRWVYPGLDELSMQMPSLSQAFPIYHLFASKTFEELFPPKILAGSTKAQAQTLASILVENAVEGYRIKELPLMSQVSPIFGFAVDDFDQDGFKDILAVGNLYDCQPSIGRLDASYGTFLKGKGNLNFEYIEPLNSGFAVDGEARDIKLLRATNKKRLILISRNNDSVCLLK